MTHLIATTELVGRLITSVTGIDDETDSENFQLCLRFATKEIRSNVHPRVNKFDVKDQLTGLEEKFHVLNNPTLGEKLHGLLAELDRVRLDVKPEVLDLLLKLSENLLPSASRILVQLEGIADAAEAAAKIAENREQSWKEINNGIDEHGDGDEGIWDVINYAADSSDSDWDDEEGAVFAKVSKNKAARAEPQKGTSEDGSEEDGVVIDEFIEETDVADVKVLRRSQFWSEQKRPRDGEIDTAATHTLSKHAGQNVWLLSELQVVREVIFMLYCLPCSLYDVDESDELVVNTRYSLRHASPGMFHSVLDWFGTAGTRLRKLQSFTANEYWTKPAKTKEIDEFPQAFAARRTFVEEIEKKLSNWRQDVLVPIEEDFVVGSASAIESTIVSLIDLQRKLEPSLKPFLILSEIVDILPTTNDEGVAQEPAIRASKHLELLFDCASELQSLGDTSSFEFITGILFPCIATYLRPIIRWMETGELREADGEGAFFVGQTKYVNDVSKSAGQVDGWLRALWHDRYILKRGQDGIILAPSFMRDQASRVFVTGKSVLFLRKLRGEDLPVLSTENVSLKNTIGLSYDTVCGEAGSMGSLLAFSDLFATALSKWVGAIHVLVTMELRDVLYYDCGLWESLEALSDVYFMRDGHAMTSFCTAFFNKIDRGRDNWDDRFLLTELIQSVYSDNTHIDISQLSVRNSRGSLSRTARMSISRRSTKILHQVSVDYRLSWPIMNIIKEDAIAIYGKIWTLLLMVRRAVKALDKIRLRLDDESEFEILPGFFAVRWRLLAFVNLIHAYFTDLVLWPETEAMKVQLAQAIDVDGMIKVHQSYIVRLQDLCLLGEKFAPLYQALISILDLAIAFADDHATTMGEKMSFETSNRSIRNISEIVRPKYRRRRGLDSDDESSSEVEDEDEHAEDRDGNATDDGDWESKAQAYSEEKILAGENRERDSMSTHAEKFDKLVTFLTAGLKSIARAGVYSEMIDILAERLEMGAVVGGMKSQEFGGQE